MGRRASYGAEQGPGRLIEPLAAWLGRREERRPRYRQPECHNFHHGGVSQGLDLLCTLLTRPGDAVLVESPTYFLALRIFRDHGLELVPVPGDEDGLRVDAWPRRLTISPDRAGSRASCTPCLPSAIRPAPAWRLIGGQRWSRWPRSAVC